MPGSYFLNRFRSVLALLLCFVAVVFLSLGTDAMLRGLGLFPPINQPMNDQRLLVLAFAYRSLYSVIGGYLVARFAPYAPMGHALVSGVAGLVLGTAGVIAMWNLGSHWYSIALAATALPYAWLGGILHRKVHSKRQTTPSPILKEDS